VNDRGLGEEGLDEPAGVEQGLIVSATKYVQHHEERQVIED
jgi:hypothetical protein